MAGLVPAISFQMHRARPKRDAQHEAGHDSLNYKRNYKPFRVATVIAGAATDSIPSSAATNRVSCILKTCNCLCIDELIKAPPIKENSMLEGKSTDDLRAIAMAGGGLEINGGHFSTDDLRAIAMALAANSLLVIHNSKTKSTDDLRAIAMAGKGRVIFA